MWKSCSRCGKIHDSKFNCYVNRSDASLEERRLRATYAWTQKSIEIRNRADWLCEVCRDKGKITYDDLEVHHIVSVREDSDKLLDNFNLVCLCVKHHKMADAGQLDRDYLKSLAERREKNPPWGA